MWITTGTGPERNFKICNKPVPNRNGISTYGKQPVPDRNGILFYGKQPVLDQNGRNLKQLALILPYTLKIKGAYKPRKRSQLAVTK